MTADAPLDITTTDDGLALVGDIDAHTAPLLAEAIASCDHTLLLVDMPGIEFVDSSGLRVLIEAHQTAQADGRKIQISNPSTAVTRLLEISGIDDYLNIAG